MTVPCLVGTDFGGPQTRRCCCSGRRWAPRPTPCGPLPPNALRARSRRRLGPARPRPQPRRSVPDADLAAAVLALADSPGAAFHYAGDSVGGAVGLQLLLDAPDRISSATLLCTGAVIGDRRTGRPGRDRAVGHRRGARARPDAGSAPGSPTATRRRRRAARCAARHRRRRLRPDLRGAGGLRRHRPTRRDQHAGAGDRRRRGRRDAAGIVGAHRLRCQGRAAGRARRRWPPRAGRSPRPGGRPHHSHVVRPDPSTTRAWRCDARCSATPTSTARSRPPPTSPRTSRK